MKNLFLIFLIAQLTSAFSQEVIKLWEGEVPFCAKPKAEHVITEKFRNQWRITEVTDPELVVYKPSPEKANGMGLIVCPGGAYVHLHHAGSGSDVAQYFSKEGFTCFVLHYQVPKNREGALSDATQAVKVVRERAGEWELEKDKIGMIGSSAGAHLTAHVSTQTDDLSGRPNFSLLLCPAYLNEKKTGKLSPEFQEMKEAPPFFVFTAEDDKNCIEGTRVFKKELSERGINHEVHTVPVGGHGFCLKEDNPAAEAWPPLALKWIKSL